MQRSDSSYAAGTFLRWYSAERGYPPSRCGEQGGLPCRFLQTKKPQGQLLRQAVRLSPSSSYTHLLPPTGLTLPNPPRVSVGAPRVRLRGHAPQVRPRCASRPSGACEGSSCDPRREPTDDARSRTSIGSRRAFIHEYMSTPPSRCREGCTV